MSILIDEELLLLHAFVRFLLYKGYDAAVFNDSVVVKNINNENNNFRIIKQDGYYMVYTICVSKDDYEYSAKCMIYVLLAEYNKSNGTSTHLHMNFKVDL